MAQATNCKTISTQNECQTTKGCQWKTQEGSHVCDWCQVGYYKTQPGPTCTNDNCTTGSEVVNPGRTECISDGRCPENSTAGTNSNERQCFCSEGYGANAAGNGCEPCSVGTFRARTADGTDTVVCTQCAAGQVTKQTTQSSCITCGALQGGPYANLHHTDCTNACSDTTEVLQNSQCYCAPGYGLKDNVCTECDDGIWNPGPVEKRIGTQNLNRCTGCADPTIPIVNFRHDKCIAEAACTSIANAEVQNGNQCACKEGFILNSDKTACVDGINTNSTTSAATVVAIVMALLAVVVAAATAAAVAVKARKARAAEAEALTVNNM